MNDLLEYEASILVDLHNDSSLVVLAEGLGVDTVTYALVKLHSDPHNLIIVLNYRMPEARFLISCLEKDGVLHLPSIISSEVASKDRENIYKKGGVVFVSSRILVVDLLMEKMPVALITDVLILRAHELQEASQDCFAINLLRERNTNLCIKAISDNAVSLTSGYSHAERIMKQLGISKLILWPRFNLQVISCLNQIQPHVEEVRIKLTPELLICQSCILDLLKASIKELTVQNPSLNIDDLTLEKALLPNFDNLIYYYIDPVWNQLNSTSRRLIGDITSLRRLLRALFEEDAVKFLNIVEDLRQTALSSINAYGLDDPMFKAGKRLSKSCPFWFLMDQADRLFCSARSRVYKDFAKKLLKIELCPKWKTLIDILKDIDHKLDESQSWIEKSTEKINLLILVGRECTARMLERFLTRGSQSVCHYLAVTSDLTGQFESKAEQMKTQTNTKKRSHQLTTLTQMCKKSNLEKSESTKFQQDDPRDNDTDDDILSMSSDSDSAETDVDLPTPVTTSDSMPIGCHAICLGSRILLRMASKHVQKRVRLIIRVAPTASNNENGTFVGGSPSDESDIMQSNGYRLAYVLDVLKPAFVILYEPRLGWIRELEVHNARRHFELAANPESIRSPIQSMYIYFMLYEGSVEEQRYLTTLRREKEAFESLIQLKSTIVVSRDAVLPRLNQFELDLQEPQPRVIVDMREFRSELPALLHRKGMKIEPMTLTTADYILAPHLCVERKSIQDLVGSLKSGRLYQQCVGMSRHYPNPILLIEFSMPNKVLRSGYASKSDEPVGFSLYEGKHAIDHSAELNAHHLLSKITLLTIHFPNLRIFWSMTPYCTAELFAEIKLGRAEPSVDKLPQTGEHLEDHNVEAVDMLLKLPGISWKNYRRVMNNVQSLSDLADCNLEQLTNILDSKECANKLYTFLHTKFNINKEEKCAKVLDSLAGKSKVGSRFALAGRVKTQSGRLNKK